MEFLDCYIRVSGAEQKSDGNSLAVQEDMAQKEAKKANASIANMK